MLGYEKD